MKNMLYIICPKTGQPVETGFNIPPRAVNQATLKGNVIVCDLCGEQHTWDGEEAFRILDD